MTAVIFVAALSEYDQTLFEDDTQVLFFMLVFTACWLMLFNVLVESNGGGSDFIWGDDQLEMAQIGSTIF